MQKIKQAFYTVFAVALLTIPAIASAQWGIGQRNARNSELPGDSIYKIIEKSMNWLLAILGFIGVIGFVIAGILYLTAAGSEDQIEKAKSAMMYSILGIVVALVGVVAITAVSAWLTAGGTTQF